MKNVFVKKKKNKQIKLQKFHFNGKSNNKIFFFKKHYLLNE